MKRQTEHLRLDELPITSAESADPDDPPIGPPGFRRVRQVRSAIGSMPSHRNNLKGLGLGRIGYEIVLRDTREIRGMINKVSHLVITESVSAEVYEKAVLSRQRSRKRRKIQRQNSNSANKKLKDRLRAE